MDSSHHSCDIGTGTNEALLQLAKNRGFRLSKTCISLYDWIHSSSLTLESFDEITANIHSEAGNILKQGPQHGESPLNWFKSLKSGTGILTTEIQAAANVYGFAVELFTSDEARSFLPHESVREVFRIATCSLRQIHKLIPNKSNILASTVELNEICNTQVPIKEESKHLTDIERKSGNALESLSRYFKTPSSSLPTTKANDICSDNQNPSQDSVVIPKELSKQQVSSDSDKKTRRKHSVQTSRSETSTAASTALIPGKETEYEEKNNCVYCGAFYQRKKNLRQHLKTCDKIAAYNKAKQKNEQWHVHFETEIESKTCKKCSECFTSRSQMLTHSKNCNPLLYSGLNCRMCGFKFNKVSYLRVHSKSCELREKYFDCINQGKTWNVPLQDEGQTNFQCKYCKQTFTRKIISMHQKICTKNKAKSLSIANVRKSNCIFCNKEFSNTQNGNLWRVSLRKHEYICSKGKLTMTDENCMYCGNNYKGSDRLTRHEIMCKLKESTKKKLLDKNFTTPIMSVSDSKKCRHCERVFKDTGSTRSHERSCKLNPDKIGKPFKRIAKNVQKFDSRSNNIANEVENSQLIEKNPIGVQTSTISNEDLLSKHSVQLNKRAPTNSENKNSLKSKGKYKKLTCIVCHVKFHSQKTLASHQIKCLKIFSNDKTCTRIGFDLSVNSSVPKWYCKTCNFRSDEIETMRLHEFFEHC